jgi:four helix bundle protein
MSTQFDHEKLDVYQLSLGFVSWATALLAVVKAGPDSSCEVRDQLDRASLSILLNIAEGNGKRPGRNRARYFDDARGSATECAACLDALVAKGLCGAERVMEGKGLLVRIASMLTRLVERAQGSEFHEDRADYGVEHEDENEHEDDLEKESI